MATSTLQCIGEDHGLLWKEGPDVVQLQGFGNVIFYRNRIFHILNLLSNCGSFYSCRFSYLFLRLALQVQFQDILL